MHRWFSGFVVLLGLSVTACGSTTAAEPARHTANATPETPAMARWGRAQSFLGRQTKPTEMVCHWMRYAHGKKTPVARPATFHDFSDRSPWEGHLVTRWSPTPHGTYRTCAAMVPASVPYGQDIESYLAPYGLVFGPSAPGLESVEIAYPGQNASDPDRIYRDKPGLFGLRVALGQLGTSAFEPGTSKVLQPTTDARARTYLRFARPLLRWYDFRG